MKELTGKNIAKAIEAARASMNRQLDEWGFPDGDRQPFRQHIVNNPLQPLQGYLELARVSGNLGKIREYRMAKPDDMSFLTPKLAQQISDLYEEHPRGLREHVGTDLQTAIKCSPYSNLDEMVNAIKGVLLRMGSRAALESLEKERRVNLP